MADHFTMTVGDLRLILALGLPEDTPLAITTRTETGLRRLDVENISVDRSAEQPGGLLPRPIVDFWPSALPEEDGRG